MPSPISIARNRRSLWLAAAMWLAAILTPAVADTARPGYMKILEHAAETSYLDLALTSSTSGTIRARRCDDCEEMTLRVDANTVVLQNGQRLSLLDAERIRDRGATVMFDPDTLMVTRILMRAR